MKKYALVVAAGFLTVSAGFMLWIWDRGQVQTENSDLEDGYQRYKNTEYNFSVDYPQDWNAESYSEDAESDTIVFKKSGEKNGFQIFISPFSDLPLTEEKIRLNLPSIIMEEVQPVTLNPSAPAENRIKGLIFWSEDPAIGRTREAWFAHNGYLYQITAYAHLDTLLAGILSSWNFNQ